MRREAAFFSLLALLGVSVSCSSGPRPPEPGTPAFFWAAAESTYRSGDFLKTSENLSQLKAGDSEFAGRARPLAVVLSAGIARGYADLADDYEAGARLNRANPTPFHKQTSNLRSLGGAAILDFAESLRLVVSKDQDANLTLAFPYPTGSLTEPPAVRKISGGMLMQDAEKDQIETAMLQRGVVMTMTQVVGAPDDSARTLELFKSGSANVPRATFLFGGAKALYDLSALYGPTKMDLPDRLQLVCGQALDTLHAIPPGKEIKALEDKIEATLKKQKHPRT